MPAHPVLPSPAVQWHGAPRPQAINSLRSRRSVHSRALDAADEIERAHGGDRAAQRALSERLLPIIRVAVARRLFTFARAQRRDPAGERDDLVHGVLLRLFENDWRTLRAFDPSRGSLDSYVAIIADRHVLSVFRTKAHDPYADVPMDDEAIGARLPPEQGAEARIWARSELHDLLDFLGRRLDERGMMLFHMLEVDALPVPEICSRSNMSRDALYQWRARLRKLVRKWQSKRQ
jgi:RNA polymerase sigma factor (sigma-70 family)